MIGWFLVLIGVLLIGIGVVIWRYQQVNWLSNIPKVVRSSTREGQQGLEEAIIHGGPKQEYP